METSATVNVASILGIQLETHKVLVAEIIEGEGVKIKFSVYDFSRGKWSTRDMVLFLFFFSIPLFFVVSVVTGISSVFFVASFLYWLFSL